MKRLIPFFSAFLILAGICMVEHYTSRANAETVLLSGSSISLEIIDSTKADAISDSLTDVHENMYTEMESVSANITSTVADVADTLTNTHKNVLAKAAFADSLTDFHENMYTGLASVAANITNAVQVAVDSTNATHSNIVGRIDAMFEEMEDVAINESVTSATATTVIDLSTAGTRYIVRNLRLKATDPGANTITITLYELINDVLTAVDTFAITTGNYTTYFCLPELFTVQQLAGDNLKVDIQTDAGTYTVTGQYSYGKTNN